MTAIPATFGAVVPGEHHIELASGRYLNLSNPDPGLITLEDVASGLANTCRFAGQTRRFYSVAEHACLVHDRLKAKGYSPEVVLGGLHHDDAEAFIGDVTRPLKALLPEYVDLEVHIADAIERALGLPDLSSPDWALVKDADDWALSCEAYHLLPSKGSTWFCAGFYDPDRDSALVRRSLGREPYYARGAYLRRHYEAAKEVR